MRRQPCAVRLRIIALDQRHLLRRLLAQIPPLVRGVVAHAERRPDAVRVVVRDGDEVRARGVVGDVDVAGLFGGDVDDLRGKGGWVSWSFGGRGGVNVPRPCR